MLQYTSSQTQIAGFPGSYYLVRHLQAQNKYNVGDKGVIIDVSTNNYVITLNLADYKYIDTDQKMVSTLKIVK